MNNEVVIVIGEDDPGHASLMKKNLTRAGIVNRIIHFNDGDEILAFLFGNGNGPVREPDLSYLLLLDIHMPKVDGMEVLKRIKGNEATRKIPIIVITTTDDPLEIEKCYELGCNSYIVKPVLYDNFVDTVRQLARYLMVMEVP